MISTGCQQEGHSAPEIVHQCPVMAFKIERCDLAPQYYEYLCAMHCHGPATVKLLSPSQDCVRCMMQMLSSVEWSQHLNCLH